MLRFQKEQLEIANSSGATLEINGIHSFLLIACSMDTFMAYIQVATLFQVAWLQIEKKIFLFPGAGK